MIEHPPRCSKAWTVHDRVTLVAFWLGLIDRVIVADNPAMPVLEKRSVHELIRTMHQILTAPREVLERDREALEKPFSPGDMYHRTWLVIPPVRGDT